MWSFHNLQNILHINFYHIDEYLQKWINVDEKIFFFKQQLDWPFCHSIQTKNNYQKSETRQNHTVSKSKFAANLALPYEGLYTRFGLALVE